MGIAVMVVALPACAPSASSGPGDDGDADRATSAGSVYADLEVEYLAAGQRLYRSLYDEVGAACRELGMGTQLPDDYVEKLGTSRLQVWSGVDRVAVRHEVYTYTSGNVEDARHCNFEPATLGLHVYMDSDETVSIDLATGIESRAEARPEYEWKRESVAALDDADAPAQTKTIAGVPCRQYDDLPGSGATYCIWSAGGAYGFDTRGRGVGNAQGGETYMLTGLVVDQTPSSEGNGQRVRLKALVLDDDAPFAQMRPHPPTSSRNADRAASAGAAR